MNKKYLAVIFRIIYLGFILWTAIEQDWFVFAFTGGIFLVTLPILYLAQKDDTYYVADILLMALFILARASGIWYIPLETSMFGPDKLFHFVGGLFLGVLAYIALRKNVKKEWILYLGIPLFSLAIGAGWEVFEWVFLVLRDTHDHVYNSLLFFDTMLDLVVDTLGGLVVSIYAAISHHFKGKP